MHCCTNCFSEQLIKEFIEENEERGDCDYCYSETYSARIYYDSTEKVKNSNSVTVGSEAASTTDTDKPGVNANVYCGTTWSMASCDSSITYFLTLQTGMTTKSITCQKRTASGTDKIGSAIYDSSKSYNWEKTLTLCGKAETVSFILKEK